VLGLAYSLRPNLGGVGGCAQPATGQSDELMGWRKGRMDILTWAWRTRCRMTPGFGFWTTGIGGGMLRVNLRNSSDKLSSLRTIPLSLLDSIDSVVIDRLRCDRQTHNEGRCKHHR
jgi:hypothetical protein